MIRVGSKAVDQQQGFSPVGIAHQGPTDLMLSPGLKLHVTPHQHIMEYSSSITSVRARFLSQPSGAHPDACGLLQFGLSSARSERDVEWLEPRATGEIIVLFGRLKSHWADVQFIPNSKGVRPPGSRDHVPVGRSLIVLRQGVLVEEDDPAFSRDVQRVVAPLAAAVGFLLASFWNVDLLMFVLFGGLDLDLELFFEQVADHGAVMGAAISPVDVRWCCLNECFCSDALDVASNSDHL